MVSQGTVVTVNCDNSIGDLKHIWTSIGFDEINWSYTPRGKDLLKILKDEVMQRPFYVRNHNAFTSGNCLSSPKYGSTNIYTEDEHGNPIYNFHIVDRIYDTYIENNFMPIIELDFMPYDLVPNTSAQQDYDLNGWKYPPKDYNKWLNLIQTFVRHLYERYGKQIENWYFEVWNEPNVDHYWLGSFDDYCRLYDYSVQAVKSINPNLKIGGPALATNETSGEFLKKFLAHVTNGINYATKQTGTPMDFISFHTKGAYYSPLRSYGHSVSLQYPSITRIIDDVRSNLSIINEFPKLNDRPIFVDECDPTVGAIYGVYDNPNFIVCNTEYYPSMFAEMVYSLLSISPRIQLMTSWDFYMEGKRLFEGNRTLITNYNLYLPVLNGFKLFEKLQTKRLSVDIQDTTIPLHAVATYNEENFDIQLLLFSHTDNYTSQQTESVTIVFHNIKLRNVLAKHYRIDSSNNNIYSKWIQLGKPENLTDDQVNYFQKFQQLKLFQPPSLYEILDNRLILDSLNISTHSIDFFEIVNLDY